MLLQLYRCISLRMSFSCSASCKDASDLQFCVMHFQLIVLFERVTFVCWRWKNNSPDWQVFRAHCWKVLVLKSFCLTNLESLYTYCYQDKNHSSIDSWHQFWEGRRSVQSASGTGKQSTAIPYTWTQDKTDFGNVLLGWSLNQKWISISQLRQLFRVFLKQWKSFRLLFWCLSSPFCSI